MLIGKSVIYLYSLINTKALGGKGFDNTLIPKYYNFRDLCIVFDYNIKFNIHINNICSRAYRLTYTRS